MDCSPPGSSVHGILQARTLEWEAIPSSRNLPNPGIKPASLTSPALAGGFCLRKLREKLRIGKTKVCTQNHNQAQKYTSQGKIAVYPSWRLQRRSMFLSFPSSRGCLHFLEHLLLPSSVQERVFRTRFSGSDSSSSLFPFRPISIIQDTLLILRSVVGTCSLSSHCYVTYHFHRFQGLGCGNPCGEVSSFCLHNLLHREFEVQRSQIDSPGSQLLYMKELEFNPVYYVAYLSQ